MTTATLSHDLKPSSSMRKSIVFEDDEIRVIFKPGTSTYLLVTFGDLKNLADDDQFYAEKPASKLNITCLGIMAKRPNWFPQKSVAHAEVKLNSLLTRFPEVITYGGSMGGYAAIKYSALFKSSTTLAFCPQWSIDPNECKSTKSGYDKYFSPTMTNMGIKPDNIGGKIFVLYDPAHRIDTFHAESIMAQHPNTSMIPVHFANHHVTTILAGTSQLDKMIDLARKRQNKALTRMVCKQRKHSPIRTKIILNRAFFQHPKLVANLLKNSRKITALRPGEISEINEKLLPKLLDKELFQDALHIIELLIKHCDSDPRTGLLKKLHTETAANIEQKKSFSNAIKSFHETILSYNLFSGQVIHRLQDESSHTTNIALPFNIDRSMKQEYFFITSNTKRYYLQLSQTGTELTTDRVLATPFLAIQNRDNTTSFLSQGRYLCAEKNGRVSINRARIDNWEKFHLVN